MNQEEAQTRMIELEQQIAELPVGSITRKTVNGKIYFYQRWSENGKRREKYIPLDEVDAFREQIEHRKTLEQVPDIRELEKPLLIAEDFAFYQKTLPGVFLLLGTGTGVALHSDRFNFDESVLAKGVEMWQKLLPLARQNDR